MAKVPKHAPKSRTDIDSAERAVDRAFTTGKVDRALITRQAQLDAAEAVAMVGVAMESDAEADEANKLAIIANGMGTPQKTKVARERERVARKKAKSDHKAATKSAKRAYEAIKFSDPSSLGFLRVVQVGFLFNIVMTIIGLLLTSRDTVSYDPNTMLDWILVVLQAVAFYFFVNRYKLGRPMLIAIAAITIVGKLIVLQIDDTVSVGSFVNTFAFNLFLILYFTFSSRVKAELVNDLSHDTGAIEGDELIIDRRSWPFWRNIIIYFVVFSVLGHWLEAGYCQLIRLGLAPGEFHAENTMLWRDWFYPYPMHGTAVVLMALILYPLFEWFKKRFDNRFVAYTVSYATNVLTVTIIELVGGLLFNAQLQNWDYTNMPFNFMGQVCLTNSLLFGVAASIVSWWIYPMCERMIARVRPATMNIVCVVIAVIGAILFSLYAIAPPEGIDLGEYSNQEAKRETDEESEKIAIDLVSLGVDAENLQHDLANSSKLDEQEVKEMEQQVDEIKAAIEELAAKLKDHQKTSE